MSVSLLLDTNVWVDNYCADHVASRDARNLIAYAYGNGIKLLYAVGCIKDVFYVLGHEFKRMARQAGDTLNNGNAEAIQRVVWGCVDNMCQIATAVGADEADVWLARKYKALTGDLEDNMVLAAARRSSADYLVTSDQELLRRSSVAALSPSDMLTLLKTQTLS